MKAVLEALIVWKNVARFSWLTRVKGKPFEYGIGAVLDGWSYVIPIIKAGGVSNYAEGRKKNETH